MNNELEQFKTEISLPDFANSIGYQLDKKASSKNSWVMRRDYDKIIIATDLDGHGIYFSARDENDHGTIIDFTMRRLGLNLGQVRKELRSWRRSPTPKPAPTGKDRQKILAAFSATRPAPDHSYLVKYRKLNPNTLQSDKFIDRVRMDKKNNAIFPHYDHEGLSGYEIKNLGFTGFSPAGTKGLWYSTNLVQVEQIIIVESAIDALSHAQLFPGPAAYASIGGTLSTYQIDLIQSLIWKATKRGAKIFVGTDTDNQGEQYADLIINMGATGRLRPTFGKDWNAML